MAGTAEEFDGSPYGLGSRAALVASSPFELAISLRAALAVWEGKLLNHASTTQATAVHLKGHLRPHSQQHLDIPETSPRPRKRVSPSERAEAAVDLLVESLEEAHVPAYLISDVIELLETFSLVCLDGQSGHGSSSYDRSDGGDFPGLRPTSSDGGVVRFGLPVHATSIGRRASASYCVYDGIGGWETLSAGVEGMMSRLMADSRVAPLFKDVDEQELKTHMLEFLSCAFGGGGKARHQQSVLTCGVMCELRNRHGLDATHFDIMLAHLRATLEDLSVPQTVIGSAMAILRGSRYMFASRSDKDSATSSSSDSPTPAEGTTSDAAAPDSTEAAAAATSVLAAQ